MSNNKLDKQYTGLLRDILDNGVKKQTRNGDVLTVFSREIRHKMSDGFPLLTTKKMYSKGIVTELIWFLQGRTDLRYLLENDCNIWTGDAYKKYESGLRFQRKMQSGHSDVSGPEWDVLSKEEFIERIKTDDEFSRTWGDLGKIYGFQWRSWNGKLVTKRIKEEGKLLFSQNVVEGQIDQIANLINDLKNNPDSRRLMVNAWNPSDLPITDNRSDDELYNDYLKQI